MATGDENEVRGGHRAVTNAYVLTICETAARVDFPCVSLPAWCVGAYTTIRDRQGTSPVRETQLENAQMRLDDDDSDDGVRASARTPLPAAGSRCLVDEYRPRWTDGRLRAGSKHRGFKDGSEGADRELLSALMLSSVRHIFTWHRPARSRLLSSGESIDTENGRVAACLPYESYIGIIRRTIASQGTL